MVGTNSLPSQQHERNGIHAWSWRSNRWSQRYVLHDRVLIIALTTKTFEYCAREATQIFGGLAYSRGGQGEKVERLYREVRAYSIPGGSEEIMIDLSMRQSIKVAQALGAKL
jgi:alkylation response protein AidB-like acyl-CoA dehydrogenase